MNKNLPAALGWVGITLCFLPFVLVWELFVGFIVIAILGPAVGWTVIVISIAIPIRMIVSAQRNKQRER